MKILRKIHGWVLGSVRGPRWEGTFPLQAAQMDTKYALAKTPDNRHNSDHNNKVVV